jgi:hypothetical protein
MQDQESSWNAGDIDGFMEHYWNSDSLQFMSNGKITYGWDQTLRNYKKSYPDKATMGSLKFDNISHYFITDTHCMVTGKWHLKRETLDDVGGMYSLLWKVIDGRWVIISDTTT